MRELVGPSKMSLLKVLVLFCVMMYGGATLNMEDNVQISTGLLADAAAFSVIPSQSNTSFITPSIILSSKELFSPTTSSFTPSPTTPTSSTTVPSSTTPSPTTPSPTTPSPTTPSPTTPSPTTPSPTTPSPTTPSPTTPSPTTPAPLHPVATNWTVVDEENNVTCLVVKLVASFDIPYVNVQGKSENATIVLPGNAISNGTCNMEDSNRQAISLQWVVDKEDSPNMLTLVFQKNISSAGSERNSSKEQFYLSDVILQIYPDSAHFPNSSNVSYIYGKNLIGNLFPVEVNNSYRCNSEQTVELKFGVNTGFVHFTNVQLEAFRSQMNDKFSTAMDCPADKIFTSDIVPIAVGCALAALVVIVLVAYLIGRRRARQRGYQSV